MWNKEIRRRVAPTLRAACMAAFALGAAVSAVAGDPPGVALTAPDGALRLAPGETGMFRLRAEGDSAFGANVSFYYGDGEYVPAGTAPAAGCPALPLTGSYLPVSFDPTQAGGVLDCVYGVTRNADSINDLYIGFSPPNYAPGEINPVSLIVGAIARLQLAVQTESSRLRDDGHAEAIVRLTVHSSTPVSLNGLTAGECYYGMSPFGIDGNIPDGCGDNNHFGGGCFAVDVPYGFRLAPVPAFGTRSCLVKLTSRQPYSAPLTYGIGLYGLLTDGATGGTVLADSLYQPGLALRLALDGIWSDGFE